MDQMASGSWPEAPGEAAVLPELFVAGGFPSKSKPELIGKDGTAKPIFRRAFEVHRTEHLSVNRVTLRALQSHFMYTDCPPHHYRIG